jgi:hypothetical protein
LSTAGLSPGVYEIRVAVDPDNRVAELDERNNELITSVTLQAAQLPDLVTCNPLVVDPSGTVRRGRTVTLSICVANDGDAASGPFDVRFTHCPAPEIPPGQTTSSPCDSPAGYSAEGLYPSIVAVPALAAGEQTTVMTRLETEGLAPGVYYLNVELDYDPSSSQGVVVETNELNNLVQGAIFVVGPDLALVDLQMAPPSPVAQGQVVQAAAIVSNLGEEAAGQFNVSYYVTPTQSGGTPTTGCTSGTDCAAILVSRVFVPGLAVDAFERIVCNLDTTGLVPGSYVLRAVAELVDVPGKVSENSLLNNTLEIPFIVIESEAGETSGGPVDLAVQQVLGSPSNLSAGESGTAWVLIANVGSVSSGPFDVAFAFVGAHGETMTIVTHYARSVEPGVTDVRVGTQFATETLGSGAVTLTVTLDPAHLLPETDRANNTGTRTFRIH